MFCEFCRSFGHERPSKMEIELSVTTQFSLSEIHMLKIAPLQYGGQPLEDSLIENFTELAALQGSTLWSVWNGSKRNVTSPS